MVEKHILKNGLTLLIDRRNIDTLVLGAMVKVGSNDEHPKERGIAHFLEHMLFEGTATKSAKQLTYPIESIGGESNATTTNERTFFYVVVPKKYYERAIAMMAEMMQNESFNQEAFEKEKKIILDEIKMLHDDPKAYQWVLFLKTLFKKNRTKLPVYGDVNCIKKLQRKDVVQFYQKYYNAKNMIISICGDIPNIKEKIEKALSNLRDRPVERWENPVEEEQKKSIKEIIKRSINQTYLLWGYKTPPADYPNSPVIDVIRALLDRGQSSRLFEEIRTKRGLAYAVGAVHEASKTYGYFVVYVMTQKKNVENIRNIIQNLLQLKDITKEEVEMAKEYLEGSMIIQHENNLERAERNAFWEMMGMNHESYRASIRSVTLEAVRSAVKKYFKYPTETIVEQKK